MGRNARHPDAFFNWFDCFNEIEAILMRVPVFAVLANVQRFLEKIEVIAGAGGRLQL